MGVEIILPLLTEYLPTLQSMMPVTAAIVLEALSLTCALHQRSNEVLSQSQHQLLQVAFQV
jgi:hypothetical protein